MLIFQSAATGGDQKLSRADNIKFGFDGFTVRNQQLTPIWMPVFDVLVDLQLSKFDPPKPSKGSKTLDDSKVLTWTSGGEGGIRTLEPFSQLTPQQGAPFDHSGTSPLMRSFYTK